MTKHSKHPGRQDRLIQELEHDPYKSKQKLPEPSVCPGCGAVFHHGHWTWESRPDDAHETLCPACLRIRDRVPAGFLTLSGEFLAGHRDEIDHLIHNVEEREKSQHPLKRIMGSEAREDGLLITFTDPHLARGVGEALHHAYQGEFDFQYTEEDYLLRASWRR